jgi:hypothetical protein
MDVNYLDMFKNLQISKKDLTDALGGNLYAAKIEEPVIVFNLDVVNMLGAFKNGIITLEQMLDWVNTVWFTELFEYEEEHCDSIASVLNKLEDLDEEGRGLIESDIDDYIYALLNNKEL